MDGLPFLPGNSFHDPTRTKFHRSHTLGFRNGFAIQKRPEVGIGGIVIPHNQLSEQELDELSSYNPILTYGQTKQPPPEDFVPSYVAWDKKVLKFKAWFKETVHESPIENYRVRLVDIFYFLEDDSMAVVEPVVENSGLPQGKLIKRGRLPKNDVGDTWTWKDLNRGMDIGIYGRVFHIYDCDKWTCEFLESEGIEVNPPEDCATDPYADRRTQKEVPTTSKAPTDFDRLKQFMEMDRKVLRFYCVWDNTDEMYGERRKFVLHYYLVNDTIEVREVHAPNDGRDPFPILISRQRIPKNRYDTPSTFPGIILELSENEIKDYFTPRDFAIGNTVELYNRKFLLYDCDDFTKAFYWKNFGITDFTPVRIDKNGKVIPQEGKEISSYGGYGTLEDSMQSCLTLIPQPPKKDFVKMINCDGIVLRFEAVMDSPQQQYKGRRFIISYRLADDMITIYEPPVRNSGIISGKFLERSRVAKPGSTPEKPVFYGPQDFYIGAVIDVYRHRFVITNADAYVLKFMEQHANQFPEHTIQTLRERLANQPSNLLRLESGNADRRRIHTKRTGSPGELEALVQEVKGQLQRLAITGNSRKDRVFLGIDVGRSGFVSKQNLREMCMKQQLPCDDDIIDSLAKQIGKDPERITLEELRLFLETA